MAVDQAVTKRILVALAILALALLPMAMTDYRTFQITQGLIYGIAILGLNLVTGYSGQISLGHGAFYAIGAYTAAIIITRGELYNTTELYYLVVLPAAGLVCLVVGFLFGFPAGRLKGHYLALATFALAVAVPQILKYDPLEPLTGGVQGVTMPVTEAAYLGKPLPPWGLEMSEDVWLYYIALATMLVLYLGAWNLLRGRPGRALIAIRDNPIAASAMGINVALYKSLIFGVSAAYTGVAGALSTIVISFVAPDSFNFLVSIILVVGMVVGGLATIWGGVIGGIFIVFLPNIAEDISRAAPWAIYGALLIVMMYLMPRGVAGTVPTLIRLGWHRLQSRQKP